MPTNPAAIMPSIKQFFSIRHALLSEKTAFAFFSLDAELKLHFEVPYCSISNKPNSLYPSTYNVSQSTLSLFPKPVEPLQTIQNPTFTFILTLDPARNANSFLLSSSKVADDNALAFKT